MPEYCIFKRVTPLQLQKLKPQIILIKVLLWMMNQLKGMFQNCTHPSQPSPFNLTNRAIIYNIYAKTIYEMYLLDYEYCLVKLSKAVNFSTKLFVVLIAAFGCINAMQSQYLNSCLQTWLLCGIL